MLICRIKKFQDLENKQRNKNTEPKMNTASIKRLNSKTAHKSDQSDRLDDKNNNK